MKIHRQPRTMMLMPVLIINLMNTIMKMILARSQRP